MATLSSLRIFPHIRHAFWSGALLAAFSFFPLSIPAASFFPLSIPAAHAATVTMTNGALSVTEGEPTPAETHIFFDAATNTMSGTGHVGSQTGTTVFSFTSTTDALIFANGFSTIDPVTGLINQLKVSAPSGFLFNDLGLPGTGSRR
jgi:hypothetical protein